MSSVTVSVVAPERHPQPPQYPQAGERPNERRLHARYGPSLGRRSRAAHAPARPSPAPGICWCSAGSGPPTPDEKTVRAWWPRNPTANIGLVEGRGLVARTVDPGRPSRWVITRRGKHLFFSVADAMIVRPSAGTPTIFGGVLGGQRVGREGPSCCPSFVSRDLGDSLLHSLSQREAIRRSAQPNRRLSYASRDRA